MVNPVFLATQLRLEFPLPSEARDAHLARFAALGGFFPTMLDARCHFGRHPSAEDCHRASPRREGLGRTGQPRDALSPAGFYG